MAFLSANKWNLLASSTNLACIYPIYVAYVNGQKKTSAAIALCAMHSALAQMVPSNAELLFSVLFSSIVFSKLEYKRYLLSMYRKRSSLVGWGCGIAIPLFLLGTFFPKYDYITTSVWNIGLYTLMGAILEEYPAIE